MKATIVVPFGAAPLRKTRMAAASGGWLVGESFESDSDPIFRAGPGEKPKLVSRVNASLGGAQQTLAIAEHKSGLYVGGYSRCFRSKNGGKSFASLKIRNKDVTGVRGMAIDGDGVLWLAFNRHLESTRDGRTWSVVMMPKGLEVWVITALDGFIYLAGVNFLGLVTGRTISTVKLKGQFCTIARSSTGLFVAPAVTRVFWAQGEAGTLPKKWVSRPAPGKYCADAASCGDRLVIGGRTRVWLTGDGKKLTDMGVLHGPSNFLTTHAVDGGVWVTVSNYNSTSSLLAWVPTSRPSTSSP